MFKKIPAFFSTLFFIATAMGISTADCMLSEFPPIYHYLAFSMAAFFTGFAAYTLFFLMRNQKSLRALGAFIIVAGGVQFGYPYFDSAPALNAYFNTTSDGHCDGLPLAFEDSKMGCFMTHYKTKLEKLSATERTEYLHKTVNFLKTEKAYSSTTVILFLANEVMSATQLKKEAKTKIDKNGVKLAMLENFIWIAEQYVPYRQVHEDRSSVLSFFDLNARVQQIFEKKMLTSVINNELNIQGKLDYLREPAAAGAEASSTPEMIERLDKDILVGKELQKKFQGFLNEE